MKLISWNIAHRREAWCQLLDLDLVVNDDFRTVHNKTFLNLDNAHSLDSEEEKQWARMLEFEAIPNGNSPEIDRLFKEAPHCASTEEFPCVRKVE
jgi:hypothetical protein